MNGNREMAKMLYEMNPDKCLEQNYKGKSPYHLAVEMEDIETLQDIFSE